MNNAGQFNKDIRRDFCLPYGMRAAVTDRHIIYAADLGV
jgi:hypothetical protein